MFLICHILNLSNVLFHMSANCLKNRPIKVVELQHGWVVGKQSSLRRIGGMQLVILIITLFMMNIVHNIYTLYLIRSKLSR